MRPRRSAGPSDDEMGRSSTKFKLLSQIKGNSINDYDYFKVRNFRYMLIRHRSEKTLPTSLAVKQIVMILGSWWRVTVSLFLLQTVPSKAGAVRVIIAKRCSMSDSQ